MKMPIGNSSKKSLPGEFAVFRPTDKVNFHLLLINPNLKKPPKVYPIESCSGAEGVDILRVVYDHGKVIDWDNFSTIRQRANSEWNQSPLSFDPISEALSLKIVQTESLQNKFNSEQLEK